MKGSIRKRGSESWEISVDVGRDSSGRRLRKFLNVKGRKSVAEKKLRDLLTKLDHGVPVQVDKITVSSWADKWLKEHVQATTRQKTLERYRDGGEKAYRPKYRSSACSKTYPNGYKSPWI